MSTTIRTARKIAKMVEADRKVVEMAQILAKMSRTGSDLDAMERQIASLEFAAVDAQIVAMGR